MALQLVLKLSCASREAWYDASKLHSPDCHNIKYSSNMRKFDNDGRGMQRNTLLIILMLCFYSFRKIEASDPQTVS